MISPVKGIHLHKCSLKEEHPLAGPKWNDRETYFIYYAYGLEPVPLIFSMDFKVRILSTLCFGHVNIDKEYLFKYLQLVNCP